MMPGGDDRLRFGTTYRFGRWPQERWTRDLALIRDAGMTCVRWGGELWPVLEDAAGHWNWSLHDAVLAACEAASLGLVLSVPVKPLPDWAGADPAGALETLVSALANRYAASPTVWAWELDVDGCAALATADAGFAAWLRDRYGDLERLHAAWGLGPVAGSARWPGLDGASVDGSNPQQAADAHRFRAAGLSRLLERCASAARAAGASVVVLQGPWAETLDTAGLLRGAEVYGHAHQPSAVAEPERVRIGRAYGRVRAYAPRLWATAQQAGQTGGPGWRRPLASPGSIGLTALQSIGHGCDLVCWEPWRGAAVGTGLTVGGILPPWGEPGRHYAEVRDLIHQLGPHAETIAATRPRVPVARLVGSEQDLLHRVEPWVAHHLGDPDVGMGALADLDLNEDRLAPGDLCSDGGYLVALLPHAVALETSEVASLRSWVEAGGVLVVGPLAGHRVADLHGPGLVEPPGPLGELTGTSNGEATTWDGRISAHGERSGRRFDGGSYAEILAPVSEDVEVVARYDSAWLTGRPAVTQRPLGSGLVIHCGIALSDLVVGWLWSELSLPKPDPVVVTHDPTVEVLVRGTADSALHFVLNHGSAPAVCSLFRRARDLLSEAELTSSFTLQPKGWRILHAQ